ncbi:MAG: 30S ribosomal protein S16 [Actinomycetota bacterium]
MSVRIRLRRMGAKKRPFYRVVVADQRSPRDGRFIENIGKYHPLEDPSLIDIDEERALHWLRVGAQPSNTVRVLMTKVGIWEKFAGAEPAKPAPAANDAEAAPAATDAEAAPAATS